MHEATLKDLHQDPKNARAHNPRNVGMISSALHEVGAARSIVIDEDGRILAGNATVEAAADAGIERVQIVDADGETLVAVRRKGLTEEQKTRLALYDNRTAELAEWDNEVLAALKEEGVPMEGLFSEDELREILGSEPTAEDPGPQIDKAAELQEKWGTALGQMWELGEHRLVCGDCTDAAVVERVMGGEKAGAVVTDPPYGINREGIENDDPEGLRALFDGCLAVMPVDNAVVIAFQSPRLFPVWLDATRAAGLKFERMLWMYDENDQTKPWHYWLLCSQAILVSSVGNPIWGKCEAHHDTYTIGLSRRWRAGGDGNQFAHVSVKPSGLVADLCSHAHGIVYDPFLGSGTTLIACERLGRKCRACEIEPKYVAVTLERWASLTGKTPRLCDE